MKGKSEILLPIILQVLELDRRSMSFECVFNTYTVEPRYKEFGYNVTLL